MKIGLFFIMVFLACLQLEAQLLPPSIVAPTDGAYVIMPDVIFEWNPVSGAIEYQIQISGSMDFTAPLYDVTTSETMYTITTFTHETTYYWRICTIDVGGPGTWSAAYSFDTEIFFPAVTVSGFNGAIGRARIDVGDYDRDNEYDYLISADIGSATFRTYVYRSTSYTLTDFSVVANDLNFNNVEGEVRWLDFDNDGDLDALVSGWNGTDRFSQLYENNSGWVAVANPVGGTANFPGLDTATISAADFNGDGFSDILLTGYDGTSYIIHLYLRDDVNGYYTLVTAHGIPAIEVNSVDYADVDMDGALDLLITGIYLSTPISALFLNDGSGNFAQSQSFLGVQYGDGLFGDYDNDGDFDVVISGENSSIKYTRLYENSSGTFIEVTGAGLPGMMNCSLQWGDYDNDGDLDLLMYGDDAVSVPQYRLYVCENTGTDTFNVMNFTGTETVPGIAQWTDYNFDGKLDIVLCANNIVHVLRNNAAVFNQNPQPPVTAWETVNNTTNSVLLEWGSGTDDHTPHSGLTYNIYLGRSPGTTELISPYAYINGVDNPPGFRYVLRHGNAGKNLHAQISGLDPGVYYWSVQSVDSGYIGSPFFSERYFIVGDLTSVILISPTNSAPDVEYAPKFEWASVTGAVSYILQYAKSSTIPDWNDTSLVVTQIGLRETKGMVRATLGVGSVYHWRVGAVMADNSIVWSTDPGGSGAWSFTTANDAIRLEYAGVGAFTNTTVIPQRGFQSEPHTFIIKYTNLSNYLPIDPKIYFPSAMIPESAIDMQEVDVGDTTTSDGKLYQATVTDMRLFLTGSPGIFYSENYINFVFEFVDAEGNKVKSITYPEGTPIEDVLEKENLIFINFRDAVVMYNSVIRGAVNVVIPKASVKVNERVILSSNPALVWTDGTLDVPKSDFIMQNMLMNPDFGQSYSNEWCLVPEQLFTRYNFLTMAPAGTHTLSLAYYRNGSLVTPSDTNEIPEFTINTIDISPSSPTPIGPVVITSSRNESVKMIITEKSSTSIEILFSETQLQDVVLSWKRPLVSQEGIYYKNGNEYVWLGKKAASVTLSGTYVVLEDTSKPVLHSIAIKNGMLRITAKDDKSGIEKIVVTTSKGTYSDSNGVFPVSIFPEPTTQIVITVYDNAGNSTTQTQQISAGTIPKIFAQNKNIINYPNPFNPSTTVEVRVEDAGSIQVLLYNAKGKEVKTFHNGYAEKGVLTFEWDGKDKNGRAQPSGVYYVRVFAGKSSYVHKIVLLK